MKDLMGRVEKLFTCLVLCNFVILAITLNLVEGMRRLCNSGILLRMVVCSMGAEANEYIEESGPPYRLIVSLRLEISPKGL